MSLKVDHQTISHELKQTRLHGFRLQLTLIEAYPHRHPYVLAGQKLQRAITSLISQLATLYEAEVSHADLCVLGRLYESEIDGDQLVKAVRAADVQKIMNDEKHGFSMAQAAKAGACLIEIDESLAYVAELMSWYDPLRTASLALKEARACAKAVGSNIGPLSKSAIGSEAR